MRKLFLRKQESGIAAQELSTKESDTVKLDFTLTREQQTLVEANLSVIDKTINLFINPDEDVCDLGRSDLYQEGAIALCKAAATYDGKSAQFDTYATTKNYQRNWVSMLLRFTDGSIHVKTRQENIF